MANRKPRKQRKRKAKGAGIFIRDPGTLDIPFLVLTLLLTAIGVVMVFSASYARAYNEESSAVYYFMRQLIFALIGVAAMYAASRFTPEFVAKCAVWIYALALLLLIYVIPFGIGKESTGSNRWINLGFTTFQPSELAKVAVVLMFASMISRYKDKMQTFKYGVVPFACVLAPVAGLLVLEPHLSATIIICGAGAVLMYLGGTRLRWFAVLAIFFAGMFLAYLQLKGYASARITAWLEPESDPQGAGYQILQSLYAIGSGGLMGLGLGRSRQKYLYLPEEHNDYIFSIVCEELGFVGAVVIIILFVLLIVRGYWLALHTKNRFCSLVISGITTILALQVFFNIGVVSNFLPSTGISLPFFSYGGTALVMQLAEMGLILGFSRKNTNQLI